MHVAFVSQHDARDVRAWSGIPYYMARGLAAHVDRVSIVGPLSDGVDLQGKLRALQARLRGETYLRAHTFAVAAAWAEETGAEVARLKPDVVLAPSSLPVALLDAACPVAFWPDATFESNLYAYAEYTSLPDDLVVEAHRLERTAFERCRFAFYASDFAASSALHYYETDPAKVAVIPYGANLEEVPAADAVGAAIEARPTDRCDLLFLGAGWVRKGGDVAAKVAEALYRRGVAVTLRVVGTGLPLERPLPFVESLGYISKATAEGRARIAHLLATSHFLLLPTRAENFGCVFSEASAYGVPSLTTSVGGVPTAVQDGANGLLFPPRPDPAAIADAVLDLLARPGAYRALARSSRAEYERRLNWDVATANVARHLAEVAR